MGGETGVLGGGALGPVIRAQVHSSVHFIDQFFSHSTEKHVATVTGDPGLING